jgi:hypothetical protein
VRQLHRAVDDLQVDAVAVVELAGAEAVVPEVLEDPASTRYMKCMKPIQVRMFAPSYAMIAGSPGCRY